MVVARRLVLALALVGLFITLPTYQARAGEADGLRDFFGRQKANMMSGQTHTVFFIPATSLPGTTNTVELRWPSTQSATWCRTVGALTVVGATDPIGATEGATPLPGAITAACSQPPSGDVFTVSNVGPLVAGQKYGFSLSDGVGLLGTPPPMQGIIVYFATTDGITDIDTTYFFVSTILNDQIAVSATVVGNTPPVDNNPAVTFTGFAAPSADLNITRNGTKIFTGKADAQAKFSIPLTNQPVGDSVYIVSGSDQEGRVLSPVTFALTLSLNTSTLVTGVFLGPSISIDKTSVKIGTPVVVSGTTAPGSDVTLTVHSVHSSSFSLTPDNLGNWSKALDTKSLGVGTHTAQAQAGLNGTSASEPSQSVTFAVDPLGQFDGKAPTDLNADGRTNLVDLSILLFYWRQTNPANPRADINHDGRVDLTDFSIMLFQWTG